MNCQCNECQMRRVIERQRLIIARLRAELKAVAAERFTPFGSPR